MDEFKSKFSSKEGTVKTVLRELDSIEEKLKEEKKESDEDQLESSALLDTIESDIKFISEIELLRTF